MNLSNHQGIRQRKLYEQVVEEIGLRIIRGDYRPGDTLPVEDDLCRELSVSRGVLREAAKVLAQKGLILSRPKVGTQVLPRTRWHLFDADVLLWILTVEDRLAFLRNVTEVRCMIESEAARLAAERASDAEIATIQKCLSAMEALFQDESEYTYDRYLEADTAFHLSILDACHNELLSRIGHTMRSAVQTARRSDTREIGVQQDSLKFHQEMAMAIARHDPAAAASAARRMFDHVWRHLPRTPESSGNS